MSPCLIFLLFIEISLSRLCIRHARYEHAGNFIFCDPHLSTTPLISGSYQAAASWAAPWVSDPSEVLSEPPSLRVLCIPAKAVTGRKYHCPPRLLSHKAVAVRLSDDHSSLPHNGIPACRHACSRVTDTEKKVPDRCLFNCQSSPRGLLFFRISPVNYPLTCRPRERQKNNPIKKTVFNFS